MAENNKAGYTYADARVIQHSAVSGRRETRVRAYSVGAVCPYAQHPVSVRIAYIEPRHRRGRAFQIVPTNIEYVTVEVAGSVVYDSRRDVPCDMAAWTETDRRFEERDQVQRQRHLAEGWQIDGTKATKGPVSTSFRPANPQ